MSRAGFRRGWGYDGAGPARFGWWRIAPCRDVWVGRTWAAVTCGECARETDDGELVCADCQADADRQDRAARPGEWE